MAAIKQLKSYVGGKWVSGSGTPRPLYNPTTEEVIAETSTDGIDFAAALEYARSGGAALRAMTFEERGDINMEVVQAVDEAAQPWGVKVLRYEVADINLPVSIKDAMEKQVRAERERRAVVAESEGERQAAINRSEGDRQAAINRSEGEKQEMINISEGEKMKQINEAEGRAKQIELVALATAKGLQMVARAVREDGGEEAVSLRIAEQYVAAFEKVAKESTTLLLPNGLSDIGGTVAGLQKVLKTVEKTPA